MTTYRFGEFELDLDAFELKRQGESVKLERRALDLLALLVRNAGRLVTRDELVAVLWPPKVLIDFDDGLNTLVRKVRLALRDSPDSPTFVETVPRRGYRFIASVEVVTQGSSAAPVEQVAVAPARRNWRLWIAAAVVATMCGASLAWWILNQDSRPQRIAVLPFENLTGDENLDYLASGLAEETRTALARIDAHDLRVVGTVNRPDPALTPEEIGKRLGVDYVVQSSMRLEDGRIRVTASLVRVADNEQVWSAGINRALTNVLGVQSELSTAIAEQVRIRLSPEVSEAIDHRQTQNPEAYALYLKGRYEWSQLTPASTRRALDHLRRATETDPDYALAWAGLAFCAITSLRTADGDPAVAVPLAEKALKEAMRLGPNLVETRYAHGYYNFFHKRDYQAAEKDARAAIEIDPNNSQAHMLLGVLLAFTSSQPREAVEMMRRARELDPMFSLAFANSANVAVRTGDLQSGLEFGRQAVAMDPEFWLGHFYLGRALAGLNRLDEALVEFNEAAKLSDGHSLTFSARVDTLVRLGRRDEARAVLAEFEAKAARQYVPPLPMAMINARLGNVDAAFQWLDKSIAARDPALVDLKDDPRAQLLKADPRFADVLRRCGCGGETDLKP
jgi:TolB-like protein/DNA-binding winged helix-turn-helix (wHTH) protein/Flp pilus assembly protein TadD